ncbi:helix-turn-helix transcriptional regulator [Vibrio sp. TBV020]|uniref:helix-turn-helix transcriptional regulator n=1 Tax=Vibrio sp. TBV020 TaxID=3137398 RepID=UPI0038CD6353
MAADSDNASRLRKIALTTKIEESERQLIVGETKRGHSALVEGKFVSHRIGKEVSIHGCQSIELQNSHVVSMAPASVIITILIQGELEFGYDDLEFQLKSDSVNRITIVNLTQPASFRRKITKGNKVTKLNLMMSNDWVKSRTNGRCKVSQFIASHKNSIQLPLCDDFTTMVDRVLELHKADTFSEKLALESLAFQFIEASLSQLEVTNIASSNINDTSISTTSVEEIICYIESNLSQPLSIEDLANKFAMSSSNIQRKFKQEVGLTLNGYIRKRRLEIAKQHLERGLVSVTEAAYEAGYNHPANFTNAFKKAYGVPPLSVVGLP